MRKWTEEKLKAKMSENPDLKMDRSFPPSPSKIVDSAGNQPHLKYHSQRTWSELCQREFDSKAEARRGEELYLLEKAGEISNLRYQIPFKLCATPKVTITIDFAYLLNGKRIFEDTKGMLTRDSRTKLAWLKEKYNISVLLTE